MMRIAGLLLLLGFILSACAGLPQLTPLPEGPQKAQLQLHCQAIHPKAPFRVVHTIAADLPLDNRSDLLGVTVAHPQAAMLRAVLLSVEGLTLFDATSNKGTIQVHRAVPPLDDKDFGPGLMNDVILALMPPTWPQTMVGQDEQGARICRHQNIQEGTLDIYPKPHSDTWILKSYDSEEALLRQLELKRITSQGPAEHIILLAPGLTGYTLKMNLQEVETINPTKDLFQP